MRNHFSPVVVSAGVPALHDLVAGLQDEDVEPDAEVGGDHVHEAEARDELALVDVHLLVEEDEVHLHEDEEHLQDGAQHGEDVVAVRVLAPVLLDEHAHLDAGVDHAADAKH